MLSEISKESILFSIIKILESHKINYWITDGTLLGIIRENRLLPWDSDIDIGVWKSEVSSLEIINMFEKEGFRYAETLPDMDCLYFFFQNTQIDIGLYSKDDREVSIKWATNPKKTIDRLLVRMIALIFENNKKTINFYIKSKYSVRNIFSSIFGALSYILTNNIKEKMYSFARAKYLYLGCVYPAKLLRFKKILFRDQEIIVPLDSDEYLRVQYGENWRTPTEEYVWEAMTPNLRVFRD